MDMSYYQLMESDKIIFKKDVFDNIMLGEAIGSVSYIKDKYIIHKNGFFALQNLTKKQLDIGIKGSFVFRGSNEKYFNYLFNSVVTGKVTKNNIMIDSYYSGAVSYVFNRLIYSSIFTGSDYEL